MMLGAAFTVQAVSVMTLLQDSPPSALRGRVMAAASMLVIAPQTAAIAIGSGLVAILHFRWVLAGMVALAVIAFFLAPRTSRAPQGEGVM